MARANQTPQEDLSRKENRLRPSQTDFAILTINGTEDRGVRQVFSYGKTGGILSEDRRHFGHRGTYCWGRVGAKDGQDEFVVVHASSGDRKGPLAAVELVREVDQLFRPEYLLIVGTAGGIQKRNMNYGQVLFSRQVHMGYQNLVDTSAQQREARPHRLVRITLHDDPVQPPLDRLHSYAQKVVDQWSAGTGDVVNGATARKLAYNDEEAEKLKNDAREIIKKLKDRDPRRNQERKHPSVEAGSSEAEVEKDGVPKWKNDLFNALEKIAPPSSGEIFSGSYLVDGRASELYRSILRTFPKVAAVEMEAGAVAQAVLYSVETDRYIGYLVVKGMSDVIDSNVPHQHRKSVRKALGPLASWASAKFTLDLIKGWQRTSDRSSGQVSLVPPKYSTVIQKELDRKKRSNSEVYAEVTVEQYSHLLQAMCGDSSVRSVWTLCYLAPWRFIAALNESGSVGLEAWNNPIQVCKSCANDNDEQLNEQVEKLKQRFPHFKVFLDLAARNIPVTRILHSGKNWKKKNLHCLKVFRGLCLKDDANISCSILDDEDLQGEDRWAMSDQTVINDDLLFDYDMESQRLIVTYLRDGLKENFIRFRDHCEEMSKKDHKGYDTYLEKHWSPRKKISPTAGRFFDQKPASL